MIESVADASVRRASHPIGRSAVPAPSSKRPVPLEKPVPSSKRPVPLTKPVPGGERHTLSHLTDRAISGNSEGPAPLKPLRARAAALIIFDRKPSRRSCAASVTPDRAISGARAEQRATCAPQASERARAAAVSLKPRTQTSESESSGFDRGRIASV